MNVRLIAPLLLLVSVTGGCDSQIEEVKVEESETRPMGQFPALQTAKQPDQIKTVADNLFFKDQVPCDDKQKLATGLWALSKKGLAADSMARLADWGVDDVQLKQGDGKIVALVYVVALGDPGATNTITEHYLVNKNCNVLHWGYADNIQSGSD